MLMLEELAVYHHLECLSIIELYQMISVKDSIYEDPDVFFQSDGW